MNLRRRTEPQSQTQTQSRGRGDLQRPLKPGVRYEIG